jgi:hypothetical protein
VRIGAGGVGDPVGEPETTAPHPFAEQLVEARLVERGSSTAQELDPRTVGVHPDDGVATGGETGSVGGAEVAGAEDGEEHVRR